ncbi:hypothetical protein SKAU_G00375520 [Synaphobranchus kaupii]|uniref:Lysozyme g n=1 Tax=Synaphobranchus kaupii TaxID=118154 RepID=A0A9Q1EGW3_SYNKA|nr:hypothetical protein SKAU_G00375520 [Synaphobranchus kaupii]
MDPAVICRISLPVSLGQGPQDFRKSGWSDKGNGFGLMQANKQYHVSEGEWDSEEHISQGTEILTGFIEQIQEKFPCWSDEQQLKGGIAAYNCGVEHVQTYDGLETGTTEDDYADDVVARAQCFKKHGF